METQKKSAKLNMHNMQKKNEIKENYFKNPALS